MARSYQSPLMITIALGILYMLVGLASSFYFDVKPGAAIVLFVLFGMLVFWLVGRKGKKKAMGMKTRI